MKMEFKRFVAMAGDGWLEKGKQTFILMMDVVPMPDVAKTASSAINQPSLFVGARPCASVKPKVTRATIQQFMVMARRPADRIKEHHCSGYDGNRF